MGSRCLVGGGTLLMHGVQSNYYTVSYRQRGEKSHDVKYLMMRDTLYIYKKTVTIATRICNKCFAHPLVHKNR